MRIPATPKYIASICKEKFAMELPETKYLTASEAEYIFEKTKDLELPIYGRVFKVIRYRKIDYHWYFLLEEK